MKAQYDRKSVVRNFQAGDSVLVLLPVPGSALQARFTGPYTIERKLSDTNYIVLYSWSQNERVGYVTWIVEGLMLHVTCPKTILLVNQCLCLL